MTKAQETFREALRLYKTFGEDSNYALAEVRKLVARLSQRELAEYEQIRKQRYTALAEAGRRKMPVGV